MDAELAAAVVPYLTAAVTAYGAAVVSRVQDAAADATLGAGGRVLRRLFGRDDSGPLEAAVVELADDPADDDRVAALRWQIRKLLGSDPELAAEVREMLASAGVSVQASGARSVAAQTINGVVSTGDGAHITR